MANNDLLRRIKELEAKKNHLGKKIACISGAKASKLAIELANMKKKIDDIKKTLNSIADGSDNSEQDDKKEQINKAIDSQEKSLDKTKKEANKHLVVWISLFFVGIFIILVCFITYFRSFLTRPSMEALIDCNDIYVKIEYPYALKLNEYGEIDCVATPKSRNYSGKILIEFIRKDGFEFKDKLNYNIFDFSKSPSPSDLPWSTKIKCSPDQFSLVEYLSFLIFRKHIDVELKNTKGDFCSKTCISFLIVSFYSMLIKISTFVLSVLVAATSFLQLRLFKAIILFSQSILKGNMG